VRAKGQGETLPDTGTRQTSGGKKRGESRPSGGVGAEKVLGVGIPPAVGKGVFL